MNPQAAKDLGIEDVTTCTWMPIPPTAPMWAPIRRILFTRCRDSLEGENTTPRTLPRHHDEALARGSPPKRRSRATRPSRRARHVRHGPRPIPHGSQQSITRMANADASDDTLFHKAKIGMRMIRGGEADNHMINTAPKETLVRGVKAEMAALRKGFGEPAHPAVARAEMEFIAVLAEWRSQPKNGSDQWRKNLRSRVDGFDGIVIRWPRDADRARRRWGCVSSRITRADGVRR